MQNNNCSKKETVWFYVAAVAALLSITVAIMFAIGYHDSSYMNWGAVILPIVAAVVFVGLILVQRFVKGVKLPQAIPALVMGILNFVALLIFLYSTYLIYSEIFFGGFSWISILKGDSIYYFLCTLLYVVNVVLSNICIYKKLYVEHEEGGTQA